MAFVGPRNLHKLIFTGSRDHPNPDPIITRILYEEDAVARSRGKLLYVAVGDCPDHDERRSVDREVLRQVSLVLPPDQYCVYKADWSAGNAGGPRRNKRMVDANWDADWIYALPLVGSKSLSRGTWNCFDYAASKGINGKVLYR